MRNNLPPGSGIVLGCLLGLILWLVHKGYIDIAYALKTMNDALERLK